MPGWDCWFWRRQDKISKCVSGHAERCGAETAVCGSGAGNAPRLTKDVIGVHVRSGGRKNEQTRAGIHLESVCQSVSNV